MDEKLDPQNTPPIPAEPLDPLPGMNIPAVRTYKTDINYTVNQDKITTAKILMAEQRHKEKQTSIDMQTSVKKPTNALALIFGILFIIAGVGAVGYFGYTKFVAPTTNKASLPPSSFFLFAFDSEVLVDTTKTRAEVFSQIVATRQATLNARDNSYVDIVYTKVDKDTQQTVRLSGADLFSLYQIRLPLDISRSLGRDFAYGLYKTENRVEPFLVLSLSDYANAYSAMFEWESSLAIDLQEFFPVLKNYFSPSVPIPSSDQEQVQDPETEVATGTASTTTNETSAVPSENIDVNSTSTASTTESSTVQNPQVTPGLDRSVQFVDVVLSNRDTRAVRDSNGSPFFYYTFIERDKILFAQDPKLISEIVRKIKEKQLVR